MRPGRSNAAAGNERAQALSRGLWSFRQRKALVWIVQWPAVQLRESCLNGSEAVLSINDKDLGTPGRDSTQMVTLEVDGRAVAVPSGTSVIRAAALADVAIPKLCATDSLEPFGSCRLCLVQVEGRNGYPASCTTPVESGMKVRTKSEMLERLRRGVMELYMSDHPPDRAACAGNGNCELHA